MVDRPRTSLARGGALTVALAVVLALGGCRTALPIGELLDDPFRYEDRTVRVKGEVTDAAGLLGYGAYRVSDGTGSIVVVSRERGAPREGAFVRVDGWFVPVVTLGPYSVAAIVEKGRGRP